MPPLCLHLGVAREAGLHPGFPVRESQLGYFYLGATAPDARLLTGASRAATHFFDFARDEPQSSVEAFFAAYPELRRSAVSYCTRAFVAGYVSHLITDELWIMDVYRPCFGRCSPLAESPEADMLDRALQYELDRRERADPSAMAAIRDRIIRAEAAPEVDLLPSPAVEQWREFVALATTRGPSWERFRLFAERFLISTAKIDSEQLRAFLRELPAQLDRTLRLVTEERMDGFRSKSVRQTIELTWEYMS